jgi:hypothetical protein
MKKNWMVTKPCLLAVGVVFAFVFAIGGLSAQELAWQPSAGHTQISIWPGAAPDAQPAAGPEGSHWWPAGPGGPGGFGAVGGPRSQGRKQGNVSGTSPSCLSGKESRLGGCVLRVAEVA